MKKILAILLSLALMLAFVPSVFAADEPQGRLMDFPLMGDMATWERFVDLYNANGGNVEAALAALGSFTGVNATTVDRLRTWLNQFGAIFDNEYVPIAGHDHVLTAISGDTVTITVEDCDVYDFRIDNACFACVIVCYSALVVM